MSDLNISELVISHNANAKSFEKGEACYRIGSVQSITQREDEIQAEVKGSEQKPYRVTIGFRELHEKKMHFGHSERSEESRGYHTLR